MNLYALLLLALVAATVAVQNVPGSGDGEDGVNPDDEDGIYIVQEGSGEEEEVEGSGLEETTLIASTPTLPPNTQCTGLYCWCVYTDGTEIPGTKYVGMPSCRRVVRPVTDSLPIRTDPPILPDEKEEITVADDIVIVYELSTKKPEVILDIKSTTAKSITEKRVNNEITVPPKVSNIDEDLEEETNMIGGAWRQMNEEAVQRERLGGVFSFAHPGIVAAVIGGAVVGLLCAILLVMFIIYRMRKKDEGSYPLDDSKPLKNYAYAKAPSREFYA